MVVISCFCEHGEKTSTFLVGRRRCHKTLARDMCVLCTNTLSNSLLFPDVDCYTLLRCFPFSRSKEHD